MGLFFKHAEETSEEELDKIIGHDPIIERAYEELNRFSWNKQELLTYDQAEKYEGAYQASLAQKHDEGLEKGRQEGRQELIMNMLSNGVDVDTISKMTGIPLEEIKQCLSY